VGIVPIRTAHNDYAKEIEDLLEDNGIRTEADYADKNMNEKIKQYKTMKDPFIVVVGEKEVEERTVSITVRGQKQQLHGVPLDAFVALCNRLNETRARELPATID